MSDLPMADPACRDYYARMFAGISSVDIQLIIGLAFWQLLLELARRDYPALARSIRTPPGAAGPAALVGILEAAKETGVSSDSDLVWDCSSILADGRFLRWPPEDADLPYKPK